MFLVKDVVLTPESDILRFSKNKWINLIRVASWFIGMIFWANFDPITILQTEENGVPCHCDEN